MSEQPNTALSENTHSRWRKRLFWLGGIAAVCLAILVAIPIVTQHLATSWLQENGAGAARIENIDINLFTGTVRLFGLDASGADPLQRLQVGLAEVDVQWWPLISKHVHVDAVRLSDARIDVANDSDGNWHVGGLRFAPQPAAQPEPEDALSPAVDWGLGSDVLSLTDVSLTYRDGVLDTDLEIREISLGSHYSWQPQDSVALVVEMSINDAPISFRSDVTPWSEDQSIVGALQVNAFDLEDNRQALQQYAGLADSRGTVSFDLTLSATRDAQGVIDLQVSGPLSVMDIGFNRDGLEFSNQEFTWQGQVDLFFPATGDQPLLVVDGETLVTGTQVSLEGMTVSNDVLDWQGDVTLFAPGAAGQPMLTHNGTLQLQGTAAELTAQALSTRLDALNYTGRVDMIASADSEAAPVISASGDVSGQGLLVQHTRLPFDLVRLARVDVSDAQANFPGPVSVQALQLQELQLLLSEQGDADDTPAVFSLVQLAMANVGMDASGAVTVDTVNLDEPAIYLVRNADGDMDRISALQAAFATDTGEDQPAESTMPVSEPTAGDAGSAQPGFAIGEVTARATNFFNVTDAAVMPTVSFNLSELELAISNIDSTGANPVTVDVRSGNNSMALAVTGDVAAFAPTQSATLQVTLDALELPRFSSYIPGYNIDRGRLSTVSAISLNGEMLDIQNTVDLEQLRLAGKAAGDNAILAEGLSMPLDVALDLLRDGDDRIKLELPVTGSLSDPKFDSADIIRTVMQNALQNAAMSYVTNALQPLGTLLLIGNLANQASQPRFAPLEMRPAESALNPENREYLLKIGDLLNERPGLQLSMCGVATTADSEALLAIAISELPEPTEDVSADVTPSEPQLPPPEITEADMLALAASRTQVVTDFLSAEAGISAERLFTCRETIDTEADAQPRVQISL